MKTRAPVQERYSSKQKDSKKKRPNISNTLLSTVKIRPPEYRWCDDDLLFESSIKYKQLWIDSFFIFALIWAFGSLLNSEGKTVFDKWLKGCFDQREKDIAASLRRSAEEKIQELTR